LLLFNAVSAVSPSVLPMRPEPWNDTFVAIVDREDKKVTFVVESRRTRP
jgi:hypothetical protein